mmetsp:Transcript_4405/g.15485  ORF Transcript_4405/g.15485 Transcript_4405/m.15485 type:complete len:108 (+) Transcript_4405:1712-2035(+)
MNREREGMGDGRRSMASAEQWREASAGAERESELGPTVSLRDIAGERNGEGESEREGEEAPLSVSVSVSSVSVSVSVSVSGVALSSVSLSFSLAGVRFDLLDFPFLL